jgi:hypothetical protein
VLVLFTAATVARIIARVAPRGEQPK